MKLFEELKRRNVIKASVAYLIVAWVILQVLSTVLPELQTPKWVLRTIMFLITIGFPIWVFFSWVYEVTPQGLKKTTNVPEDLSTTAITNKRLNIIIIITLIIAIVITFIDESNSIATNDIVDNEVVTDNSIAVLPFVNISGDIEQEYFADGLSEELINIFTRLPELRVIGRTSSFAYKGKNEDLRKIGKSLDVEYILEGSVRKSNKKIRVTAQLIKSKDGSHVWSKTFDRHLDDIFEIQDEISNSVLNSLRITLSKNSSISKHKITNTEAYNYFLQGRYYYESSSIRYSTNEAMKWFNEAVKSEPSFSLAWSYLSMCYWRKSNTSTDDNFKKAKKYALKALELDPTSGIAAVNVGEILDNEYDFKGALKMIDLSLRLEPDNPYVLRNAGRFYTILGRDKESIVFCQNALKNDPIQLTAINYLIRAFYYAEQYENVNHTVANYKNLYPNTSLLRESTDVLAKDNNVTQIIEELKKSDFYISELYVNVLINAKSENKHEIEEIIDQMIDKGATSYLVALSFIEIEEDIKAMEWLEKSYLSKDKKLVYVNVEPKFKRIRNNPRFKHLIKQMNFPK
jgi:TolB-like protein